MPTDDLVNAIADLEDDYLKALLLLSLRRAGTEEPRRAALWHALGILLAEEQDRRRQTAALEASDARDEAADLVAAIEEARGELQRDLASLEAEYREAREQLDGTSPLSPGPLASEPSAPVAAAPAAPATPATPATPADPSGAGGASGPAS